jgi:hypothetical protein
MSNRLKEMGESAAWHLMVSAALKGGQKLGYALERQPGRGLSNVYEATKDGKMHIVSVRTTRDRWIAFPPLDGGKSWKTLDDVDLVLVSAVDDRVNPQNVDVYLFPGAEVRKRFGAAYAARIANGNTIPDNYGMWIMLDKGDDKIPGQVGHSLAVDYPSIARFTIDELEAEPDLAATEIAKDVSIEVDERHRDGPSLDTVAAVLAFARQKIAALTGLPAETIKLDLKMGL